MVELSKDSEKKVVKLNLKDQEKDVLIAFIQSKSLWATFYEDIESTFFEKQQLGTIFKIFKIYFDKYRNLPIHSQTMTMAKKQQEKSGNYDVELIENIDFIYNAIKKEEHEIKNITDELRSFVKINKLRFALLDCIEDIDNIDVYPSIEDKLRKAIQYKDDVQLGTNLTKVEHRYIKIEEAYERIVPTPWNKLNNNIGGGFFPKTLNVFTAASSVGKSIALDNMAIWCWKDLGLNTVMISLEMSEEIKGQRIDCSLVNINMNEIVTNKNLVINTWKGIGEKQNKIFVKEFPASTITTLHIERYLYQLEIYENFKPDIIIIDYLDILSPRKAKGSMYETGGEVFENARNLGYLYNCSIISATQLNRQAINIPAENITEEMIADSQKKMNTCDNLIAIAATPAQRAEGISTWKLLKARTGRKNTLFSVNVSYEFFKFFDKEQNIINNEIEAEET